jgi:hypothetical protein
MLLHFLISCLTVFVTELADCLAFESWAQCINCFRNLSGSYPTLRCKSFPWIHSARTSHSDPSPNILTCTSNKSCSIISDIAENTSVQSDRNSNNISSCSNLAINLYFPPFEINKCFVKTIWYSNLVAACAYWVKWLLIHSQTWLCSNDIVWYVFIMMSIWSKSFTSDVWTLSWSLMAYWLLCLVCSLPNFNFWLHWALIIKFYTIVWSLYFAKVSNSFFKIM